MGRHHDSRLQDDRSWRGERQGRKKRREGVRIEEEGGGRIEKKREKIKRRERYIYK